MTQYVYQIRYEEEYGNVDFHEYEGKWEFDDLITAHNAYYDAVKNTEHKYLWVTKTPKWNDNDDNDHEPEIVEMECELGAICRTCGMEQKIIVDMKRFVYLKINNLMEDEWECEPCQDGTDTEMD